MRAANVGSSYQRYQYLKLRGHLDLTQQTTAPDSTEQNPSEAGKQ